MHKKTSKFPFRFFANIKNVGLELEGGWKKDIGLDSDGSVSTEESHNGEKNDILIHLAKKSLSEAYMTLLAVMKKNYPDSVNSTCGFHFHLSFNNCSYKKLMDDDFYDYFKHFLYKMKETLPIKNQNYIPRLEGENTYCEGKGNHTFQAQATNKDGRRYHLLNFTWGQYRTLEVRVLPMFKSFEIGAIVLFNCLMAIENYLRKRGNCTDLISSDSIPPSVNRYETVFHSSDFYDSTIIVKDEEVEDASFQCRCCDNDFGMDEGTFYHSLDDELADYISDQFSSLRNNTFFCNGCLNSLQNDYEQSQMVQCSFCNEVKSREECSSQMYDLNQDLVEYICSVSEMRIFNDNFVCDSCIELFKEEMEEEEERLREEEEREREEEEREREEEEREREEEEREREEEEEEERLRQGRAGT